MSNLHELCIMMLDDGCMHTLSFSMTHYYNKPRDLRLEVTSQSSYT